MPSPHALPAVVVAVACLATACGGSDPKDTAASSSATTPAASASASPAPSAAPVSKDDLLAKLRSEPDMSDVSPAAQDCIAGVYLKYLTPDELRDYVAGRVTLDDLGNEPNPAASKEMVDCLADDLESAANDG